MNTDLVKLLDAIAPLKAIVIGEAMLDCYLAGFSDRMSPEAPVPVVTVTQQQQVPGGAANTAINVRALGGCVTFLSVIGDDSEGDSLRRALVEKGVSTQHILTQPGRQTLTKQRLIAGSQLLVRFDSGSTQPIDSKTEQALIEQLTNSFADCDALIVSDYGYGILTERVIAAIAQVQQNRERVVVIDSKNLSAYRSLNITAVKPNYKQAIQLLGLEAAPTPSQSRSEQIASHAEKLLHLTGAQIVAVTLDAEGAIVFDRQHQLHRTTSAKASSSGTSGAGDTYVSALTLALAAKAPMSAAADLAAAAAAVVVGKDGTTACSIQELRQFLCGEVEGAEAENLTSCLSHRSTPSSPLTSVQTRYIASLPLAPRHSALDFIDKYLADLNQLSDRLTCYRAADRRIVFTNGCFDILHAGHVSYLSRARALGDILIIGVNSDASVSRLKGSTRPINPLPDRIQVLAALSCVDCLISFEEDTPINLIRLICPNVYVKGGDYTKQTLPEALIVEELGGVVEILPFIENRSTTIIIQRICQQNGG
ncbi:MAG TPA: D-glycero-beta-D-manno-heptose 1-phosphate adenylyltransferase [Leptolyngbyaceae cyanobacterium]